MAAVLQRRHKHSPPLSLPEPQLGVLTKVDSLLDLPPIPGPKPWTDDVERAAVFHCLKSAPAPMALCAAGANLRTAHEWLSDDPPEAYKSACLALAARLKEAEHASAAQLFGCINKAAQDPRYWTAAAWTLERKHGYVVKQDALTGPAVVVNIGTVNVNTDRPPVQWRDEPQVIEAAAVAALSSSTD